MWTPHNEARWRKENVKILKNGRVVAIFVHLMKIQRIFENIISELKIVLTRSFLWFWGLVFANIPHFILEKNSEITIGGYWGSGSGLIWFLKISRGAKMFLSTKSIGVQPSLGPLAHFETALPALQLQVLREVSHCR